MNKSLLLSFILILTYSSCKFVQETDSEKNPVVSEVIKNIIAGKDTTATSLLILRDTKLPPADNPNQIKIDTLRVKGCKYYSVMAEYPDPLHNRFAIIDSDYNVLLLDKSLNGYLSEVPVKIGSAQFIQVAENFISKGSIKLKRLSLYSMNEKDETGLAFRIYIELEIPGAVDYKQEIIQLTPEVISTKITGLKSEKPESEQLSDSFRFDASTKKFISERNIFDSLVISTVENSDIQTDKSQIVRSNPINKTTGTVQYTEKTEHRVGAFSMPLSEDWNEIKNVKVSSMLKKISIGTKFINYHYGAEITVIQLVGNDSAESYIKYPLVNTSSGNYTVRFSEKFSEGLYFYQFFEYSCNQEKFLLILQTLKSTYEIYKSDYQNLINSFSMEC